MSDNAQDTRSQDSVAASDRIGRTSNRPGIARRGTSVGGESPLAGAVVMGGVASRHLHDAAGSAMRCAAEVPRSVGESTVQHLQDVAMRLATVMQESLHDMQAVFALRGPSSDHLQDLSDSVGSVVESVMRGNARVMQAFFRMTSPAAAIDLQRRTAADYVDTMLHGTTTLFRAAYRTADDALRPLDEHVSRRRQHRTEHGNGHGEKHDRIADVMRAAPPVVGPEDTVQRAVQLMREADLGGLPVRDGDRLVGMVTDRDITLRLVAEARDPTQARVREVMTPDVPFVFEDDAAAHVAEDMAGQRLRRLPVLNREKRLVGVISLVDLARNGHGTPNAGANRSGVGGDTGRVQAAA
jgi:CBS domain-containing protein